MHAEHAPVVQAASRHPNVSWLKWPPQGLLQLQLQVAPCNSQLASSAGACLNRSVRCNFKQYTTGLSNKPSYLKASTTEAQAAPPIANAKLVTYSLVALVTVGRHPAAAATMAYQHQYICTS
jgi:hypothetical protein